MRSFSVYTAVLRRRTVLRMAALLFICALAAGFPAAATLYGFPREVSADSMWHEDYYRATASGDGLSEAEMERLDTACLTFLQTWQADLSLLAVFSGEYEGQDIREFARGYYESARFGYGPDRTGFQVVWDMDTDEMVIVPIGTAETMIPESYLTYTAGAAPAYREKYGIYGPLYASMRMLDNYLKEHAGEVSSNADSAGENETAEKSGLAENTTDASEPDQPAAAIPDPSLRVGEGADMPAWYPKDPASFPQYLDETAPRVVDTADLFTAEEEASMEERLSAIRREINRDIVVFTDTSTYGLERAVYAADFYDFNGYGCGEDREGVCLFICMDPQNRGGWTCCTGPVTMGLYTEEVANQIDDMLYDFLGAGRYCEGVTDWIENFRRLYVTGSPYTPDWALQAQEDFTRTHNPDAPRVVDDACLLTEEEEETLSAQAAAIAGEYDLDVVIHTARHPGSMEEQEFSDAFYYYNGYGHGEQYDGILLTIFKRPGYPAPDPCITASGKALEKLTDVNRSRLAGRCRDKVILDEYAEAAGSWLEQTRHMLRTGRAPRSAFSWNVTIGLEALAGAIFGAISLARARSRMATPKIQTDADRYLVRDSLQIRKLADTFLDATTTKTYSPIKEEDDDSSDSSSGGGSSSYSSSYSGSSGTTHSGSGRNF